MKTRSHRSPRGALLAVAVLLGVPACPASTAMDREAQAPPSALLRHSLEVRLDPGSHTLQVTDRLTFPPGAADVDFLLNAKLSISSSSPAAREVPLGDVQPFFGINAADETGETSLKRYRVRLGDDDRTVTVSYGGMFDFGLSDQKEEYTRGFRETMGAIGEEGVYLAGNGFWYPYVGRDLFTFDVAVTAPRGWRVVSQGKGTSRGDDGVARWDSEGPVDEVVLVGGPLVRYDDKAGAVAAEVFLRENDDALAGKYLTVTGQYLAMYGALIGPYPYSKFALVENFWETGYGMPSFTLLGPQVIRFPFILHSSYPHEILHNWWGNSVFVDYDSGNWCEGLTAYMADHLVQEQRGKGDESRRATLQKYRDYVATGKDFPLSEFRSRHSAVTEAVGYGKTMMGFHMLRRRMGDDAFRKWAARFYEEHRGRRASFGDVRASMEAVSAQDLGPFFDAWVSRPGAPELDVAVTAVEPKGAGFVVRGAIRQTQRDEPWPIDVPLAVQTAADPVIETVRLTGSEAAFAVMTQTPPLALHVDPRFDLFRRLDPRETPPSIGQIFGEAKILAVIPSAASEAEQEAYRALVEGWRSESHEPEIRTDAGMTELPPDRAVWVLGRDNRLASLVAFPASQATLSDTGLRAGGETMPLPGHSFVLTARHPADPSRAVGRIVADPIEALPGLGRKLPHYGKYSYLGFEGTEPTNVLKGQWSASDSPLVIDLRPEAERTAPLSPLALPERRALAELPPVFSESKMRAMVAWLAAPEREGRGVGTAGLDAAADHIAAAFAAMGLAPGGDDGGYLQRFTTDTTPDGRPRQVANVIGVLAGTRPEWAGQSVVVGAHYDHLGLGWPDPHAGAEGKVHPGADDNASGVAVMLELARSMAEGDRPQRTVVFVAFAGEEAGLLGSRHYVDHPARPIDKVIGMVNLDTVGRLGSRKLSVLATGTATEWQHIFRGASYVTGVDSRMIPESYESSDQKSFIDRGVPAVQIFTEPHADYHRPGDTPDKVDFDGMMKVAAFTLEGVAYLGERPDPLTVTLPGAGGAPPGGRPSGGDAAGGRRVSVGTVPDFGFQGPGVKVSGVVPGSPAEAAGFREGDILIRLAGTDVASLKAYSELLRTLEPGATVDAVVIRDGAETSLKVTLVAR